MGKEIERKFLVNTDAWVPADPGTHVTQGYLNSQKERVVRNQLTNVFIRMESFRP